MKIKLYLIRHAQTFANKTKMSSIWKDPDLTPKGIEQCKEVKQFLSENIDMKNAKIFTSILRRTQETALLSIPRKKINVMDNLKEIPNFLQKWNLYYGSNFPTIDVKKQQDKINKLIGKDVVSRINYDKDILTLTNKYKKSAFYKSGDIEIFLNKNKNQFKNEMTVFLFVHGKIIRKFLNIKVKNKNCSIFSVTNDENNEFFDLDRINDRDFKVIFRPKN